VAAEESPLHHHILGRTTHSFAAIRAVAEVSLFAASRTSPPGTLTGSADVRTSARHGYAGDPEIPMCVRCLQHGPGAYGSVRPSGPPPLEPAGMTVVVDDRRARAQ
jgi:hypothetical protein